MHHAKSQPKGFCPHMTQHESQPRVTTHTATCATSPLKRAAQTT
jgi:hypothetical protein